MLSLGESKMPAMNEGESGRARKQIERTLVYHVTVIVSPYWLARKGETLGAAGDLAIPQNISLSQSQLAFAYVLGCNLPSWGRERGRPW